MNSTAAAATAHATGPASIAGQADTEPHILCSDLVRIFAAEGVEVQALQGLNLRVDRGEMVALVGASGSGKSTLLTILSGLDTPTAGVARCAGSDLLTMGRKERVQYQRHSVGFIWQQTSRNLLPYLTAAENVAMAMAVAGNKTKDRKGRIMELLALLEVGYCADRRPTELSGGEQQRTAIAVALANNPQVLLADEPTGELDEATSSDVLEAMRGVNEGLGITTLIVTHDPAVSEHVNRTIQIRDGRTSTEVLRRREVDEHGQEQHIAEEFAVLDRVGRLQLPDDFTKTLDLRERVRLALETDHVGVWPGHRPAKPRVPSSAPDAVVPPPAATPPAAPDAAAFREVDLAPDSVVAPAPAGPAVPLPPPPQATPVTPAFEERADEPAVEPGTEEES